jgi:hypothetical protein
VGLRSICLLYSKYIIKLGPDIPAIGGGEYDAFSRRYRRMSAKFVKAGEYAYWKRRYQRRSRAIAK